MNIIVVILSIIVSIALGFLCILYIGTAKLLIPCFLELVLFFFQYKYNKKLNDNPSKWLIVFYYTFVPFFIVPIVFYLMALFGLFLT